MDRPDARGRRLTQYISGPLREELAAEIAAIEGTAGQAVHFSLGFGFDAHRNKEALDILVLSYKGVFDVSDAHVQAAVRIECGARPDPEPTEPREIVPYITSEFSKELDLAVPNVTTVRPEQTFWEKRSSISLTVRRPTCLALAVD